MTLPFPIVIAIGCNIGPRRETLDRACRLLDCAGVRVARRSRLYWTRPWGVPDQPDFINAAITVRTRLGPRELLGRCQWVEQELGRRRAMHWGPRRVDLDIILYGRVHSLTDHIALPHPRLAERDFVLAPLIDLGVPPDPRIAPRGWRVLLDAIPPADRTITHVEPWK